MKNHRQSKRRRQKSLVTTAANSAASLALLAATSGCGNFAAGPAKSQRAGTSPAPLVRAQQQAPAPAAGANSSAQAAVDKFFIEGYGSCDAEVLAAFWGLASPDDAKVRLGSKMLRWGPADAQSHLPEARAQALKKPLAEMPCWYADYGYSFHDAELLAALWDMNDVSDAKLKITRALIQGQNADIQASLKDAKAGSGASAGANSSPQAAVNKFFLEGYNSCDAEVLAPFWGMASPVEAKVRLGRTMLSGGLADAQSVLHTARAQAVKKPLAEMPCWYADYGYSFHDAELLAALWDMNDVSDAKLKITRALIEGQNADIRASLKDAKARSGAL